MGEKDPAKSGGEEKKADGGKKDDGLVTVVMKLEMHCEGCAKKIKQSVRNFSGVKEVKADIETNKLTVTGKVDPTKLKQRVEDKTHKKVELISPQPKKDAAAAGGGDKKAEGKKSGEQKAEDKKPKEPAPASMRRIRLPGVDSVTIDGEKGLATVKGTMDVKELIPYLKEKLKQSVEVEGGGGDKKGKEGGGDKKGKEGGGDKKGKEGGGESKAPSSGDGKKIEEPKVEVNKMDYYGNAPSSSYYSAAPVHHQGYQDQGYGVPVYNQGYGVPVYNQHYINPGYGQGYPNQGYATEYSHPPPPPPPPSYGNTPDMFSDENPNACSVM
ncbi:hypothetical protein C3L33_12387, partial [Rhododendron williamsianum]